MGFREQYERAKPALLNDPDICPENRNLFREFFIYEEHKLKRQNGLAELDTPCCKTLYAYTLRFRTVNAWFGNKPWRDLTTEDIRRVYDGLEDGTIRTRAGQQHQDRNSFYNKVFKSKPFRLAGKDGLAREVIEYVVRPDRVVRFVTDDAFRQLVSVVANPHHLLLLWLAWDIGENVDSLLKLTPEDFVVQANRHTNESEYCVHLRPEILKRSRRSRSELTLYSDTARYTSIVLSRSAAGTPVFPFEYRQALKILTNAARRSGATSMPNDDPIRWKDLRSGMACHLLRHGWTRDEVNARLGHTPSSKVLDAYINFLALDRDAPKRRLHETREQSLIEERDRATQAADLARRRLEQESSQNQLMRDELKRTRDDIEQLKTALERLIQARDKT